MVRFPAHYSTVIDDKGGTTQMGTPADSADNAKAVEIDLSDADTHLYWPFNGELWSEELQYDVGYIQDLIAYKP